jgi:enamine deaminase RidA (YjgF/YER057c/UK114 family)
LSARVALAGFSPPPSNPPDRNDPGISIANFVTFLFPRFPHFFAIISPGIDADMFDPGRFFGMARKRRARYGLPSPVEFSTKESVMPSRIDAKLKELAIELPQASAPVANYVPVVVTGNQAFLAGQVSVWNGEFRHRGQLGRDISVEEGQKAARLCALNILAQLRAALGDLDRVRRCVKLNVFVNSTPDFTDQPTVANGASDLIVSVFGDAGKHARSAIGVAQLPRGVSVEIDAVFEIA